MIKKNLPLSTTGIFGVIKMYFKILSSHKILFFLWGTKEQNAKPEQHDNIIIFLFNSFHFCLIVFEGFYCNFYFKKSQAFWPKPKTFQYEKKFQLLQCTVDGCNLQPMQCFFQIIMIFLHDFKLGS